MAMRQLPRENYALLSFMLKFLKKGARTYCLMDKPSINSISGAIVWITEFVEYKDTADLGRMEVARWPVPDNIEDIVTEVNGLRISSNVSVSALWKPDYPRLLITITNAVRLSTSSQLNPDEKYAPIAPPNPSSGCA